MFQFLLVLVEAWAKVGLRGYHSGQKTVERATFKVHIIFYTRGEKEQRKGKEKGEENEMKWRRRKRENKRSGEREKLEKAGKRWWFDDRGCI